MPKLYFKEGSPVKLPPSLGGGEPLGAGMLRDGCYRLRWHEDDAAVYEGTLRVHRANDGIPDVSGDLYVVDPAVQQPAENGAIPIHARSRYRYYLQFSDVRASAVVHGGVDVAFERVERKRGAREFKDRWAPDGQFRVSLWPIENEAGSYAGGIPAAPGQPAATLYLTWISATLRAAIIEIDCAPDAPEPKDDGNGTEWATIGNSVGWQFRCRLGGRAEFRNAGQEFWSDADCHRAMTDGRERHGDLDREWRYHLLCVGRLKSEERGVMYDVAADSNSVVREGAAIAANWPFPDNPKWGNVQPGARFCDVPAAYFRTAVHEIGHAMGLYHDIGCCQVMLTTDLLAASKNAPLFPANIGWSFQDGDQMFLRHAPDPLVRPGGDWPDYSLETGDQHMDTIADGLELSVLPPASKLPLGAPVRVQLQLRWKKPLQTGTAIQVPTDLSLAGPHVSGRVTRRGSDKVRLFRPLLIRCTGGELRALSADEAVGASLTLLRGRDGALFPVPGDYDIEVTLHWADAGRQWKVTGKTARPIAVSKLRNAKHARAARAIVKQPDTLLTLVLGGNHLKAGMAAIDAALKNPVLRPHYAWIEAKRRAALTGAGTQDYRAAARLLTVSTVLSETERQRVRDLLIGERDQPGKAGRLQKLRVERFVDRSQPPSGGWRWLDIDLDRLLRAILWILRR